MQSNMHLTEHHSGNLDWGCYHLSTLVLWIQRVEALPWKRHPPSAMQHTVQTEPPVARVEFGMNNWRARVDNGSQKLRSATQRWIERSNYTKHWLIRQQKPSSYSSKHSQTCFKSRHCPSHLNQIHLPRAVWVQLPATLSHDPSAQPKGDLWLRIWSHFEMILRYYYRSPWNNNSTISCFFHFLCSFEEHPGRDPIPCCRDDLIVQGKVIPHHDPTLSETYQLSQKGSIYDNKFSISLHTVFVCFPWSYCFRLLSLVLFV